MKTIAILGPTGMLGSAVYAQLKDKYKLKLILRDVDKLPLLYNIYGKGKDCEIIKFDSSGIIDDYKKGFQNKSEKFTELLKKIGKIDAIINCIGITNRYSNEKPLEAFFINSALPYWLSWEFGDKLIHITTDCAFNGVEGAPYDELSQKSPNDLYGLTKALGEPSERSLVFRTSIIGPEITGFVSLIEWFKKQEGKTIKGYKTHLWNGLTTKEFGNICHKIISKRDNYPKTGLFHIFSSDVNKYEMLIAFKQKYKVNVVIEEANPPQIDRRLRSIHEVCKNLQIPSFNEMLNNL